MIPIDSKIGQEMRYHFEKLVNWYGKNELIPVYLENNIFNFYMNREVKSTESNNVNDADHYPSKNCQQSGNGDGRAVDVEMGNEQDEEPLEAEIPRVRMNPKNPTSREKQEHEYSGHAV